MFLRKLDAILERMSLDQVQFKETLRSECNERVTAVSNELQTIKDEAARSQKKLEDDLQVLRYASETSHPFRNT